MKTVDYDKMYEENTGNTETHIAVDEKIARSETQQNAFEEGFASASGVRNETAETGGRIQNPERGDQSRRDGRVHTTIESENAGLAES